MVFEFVVRNGLTSDLYCNVRQPQGSTIAELKETIASRTGIPPTQQKLLVGNASVDDLSEKALRREIRQVLPQVLKGPVEISLVKRTAEEAEWLEEWFRRSLERQGDWRFKMEQLPEGLRHSGDILMAVLHEDFKVKNAFFECSGLAVESVKFSSSFVDALCMSIVRHWCQAATVRLQLSRFAGMEESQEARAILDKNVAGLRECYRKAQALASVAKAFRDLLQVRPDLAALIREGRRLDEEARESVPEAQVLLRAIAAVDSDNAMPSQQGGL